MVTKDVEILRRLPKDKPIPPNLVTKASRLRDKDADALSEGERQFLEEYAGRTSRKRSFTFFQGSEEENTTGGGEIAVAGVYTTAISSYKELCSDFIKYAEKAGKEQGAATVALIKIQHESILNAHEREELLMERLRKETKRADKSEKKYRELDEALAEALAELKEAQETKDEKTTFDKIIQVGTQLLEIKKASQQ